MTPEQADAELAAVHPRDAAQAALREVLRERLARFPGHGGSGSGGSFAGSALDRDGTSEHLTTTAFVFERSGRRTALVAHRRLGMWLQPGGHLEPGDASFAAAARREAAEETGLGGLLELALGGMPLDVQRHELATSYGRCTAHLDVAHVFVVPDGSPLVVSEESEGLAWFAVDDLPDGTAPDLPPRLALASALLRA
ncbi:NUDIX domain-containing protein [Quadrisphaera setariae]|uniref:NUDIX domain-containing protein n=1 Tax=Quadrisphaera setariae TaxID=2593304 RepID=A0A5C8ZLR0_9ACTN|nr:NUDIX domain-containing protein [Quadrisphaera setariae]TXR58113.1 NUDIX domain-containing protein [Quadrisphaera setariae]